MIDLAAKNWQSGAVLAVLDNLMWSLRREGFAISTAQAIDAVRAAREVGFDDRANLRLALGTVLVDSIERKGRFDELFDDFFSLRAPPPAELAKRLFAQGFDRTDLGALRELLREFLAPQSSRLRALLTGGAALDHLLSNERVQELLGQMNGPMQKGFYTHRVLEEIGVERARSALSVIEEGLADALGPARARQLVQALMRELDNSEARVREQIERRLATLDPEDDALLSRPFASLSEEEMSEVRRGVRLLAERLRGAARVKNRHRKRGRLDPSRTLRKSLATGGVPFRAVRRDQRRDRPRLVVLCDVSDSVRRAARFMLEFVYAVGELFDKTRSFVFVSELGEVTRLFETEPVATAVLRAAESVVNVRENSSYARAFRAFERQHMEGIDRRTTVVVLGDGRTNYQPTGTDVVARIRARAKSVLWLCPEPRATWGIGDSAMPAFAQVVTQVFEAASARDLERAARELVIRT
jgi:uncharacterized protein with von Willebrand factor type A (vWA) domain